MTANEVLVAKSVKKQGKARKRPVRCIDTGVIYASCDDAADIMSEQGVDVNPRTIHNNCSGKGKSAAGLRWEFFDNTL